MSQDKPRVFWKGVKLKPESSDPTNSAGHIWSNATGGFKVNDNGTVDELTQNTKTQTVTNKTISIDNNSLTSATTGRVIIAEDTTGAVSASVITTTELGYLDNVTGNIQTQLDLKATTAALSAHESDTSTHGVTTVAGLDEVQTFTNKTLTAPVINSPTGIVKGDVGLGNVDNTSDATKNAAVATLTNKTIDADLNTISNIEDADIKVGAAIALNKLASLTASRVLASDGSGVIVTTGTTDAQIGYLNNVTSDIQTQLNNKASSTDLNTHENDTSTHGVTTVAGLDEVQTFTNKTLTAPVINSPTGIVKGDVGLGNVDNTSDATKDAAVATLTNKTLTAPVIDAVVLDEQASTPATPAAGYKKFYAKDDNKLYTLDDAGNEVEVGSGSGSGVGSKSFFSDYNCEDITLVSTYDDTTADPVDLTGGTATGLTVTSETTTPLTGTKSYKFSKDAADRVGKGFAIITDETLDYTVKQGESVTVKFKYLTSANYVSGDVKMYVYRVGSNTKEALNGVDGLGAWGNSLNADQTGRGEFTATISCSSTDTAIRVGFHVASTSALAYDLTVDNIFVGTSTTLTAPQVFSGSAYLSAAQTGVNTNNSFVKVNVNTVAHDSNGYFLAGSNRFVFTKTSYVQVSGTITVASTNVLNNRYDAVLYKNGAIFAWGTSLYPQVGTSFSVSVSFDGEFQAGDYVELYFFGQGNNSASTLTFGNGFGLTRLEVRGWSAGNAISSTQANFQNITARYNSDAGQSIPNAAYTIVNFEDKTFDDFNTVTVGASWKFTAPVKGRYLVNAGIIYNGVFTVSILSSIWKNNALYSLHSEQGGASVAGSQINDIVELNAGDYIDIRAFQSSGSSQALWTSNGANYVSVYKLPDMTVVGISGAPSEILTASSSLKTPAGDYYFQQMTGNSLTLGPGDWRLFGSYKVYVTAGGVYLKLAHGRWYAANGADSIAEPALLPTATGLTVLSVTGTEGIALEENIAGQQTNAYLPMPEVIVRCTQTVTIYGVTYVGTSGTADTRTAVFLNAQRIK